jgi:hypothetical protein
VARHSQQCTAVNYVQGTLYNAKQEMMAQITFSGASQNTNPFSCTNVIGLITGAISGFDIPVTLGGGAAIASAVCGAASS